MATTIAVAGRTAMLDALRSLVAGGTVELLSASNQVLAVLALSPDAGDVSAALWTVEFATGTTTGTAAAGVGTTATIARVKTSGGAVIITGWVVSLTSGSGEVKLDNTSITQGQVVAVANGSVAYP